MASNSLYPGFIQFHYQSAFGPHRMIIPTRAWDAGIGASGLGGYLAWTTTPVDADDMIDLFVLAVKPMFLSTTTIEQAIIYTLASPTALPQPRAAKTINVVGTTAVTGWAKATQRTYSMRTVDFGRFKLVLLDVPTEDTYGKVITLTADEIALLTVLKDDDSAWQGRDGSQIGTFISESITLNKRLRREYRMI